VLKVHGCIASWSQAPSYKVTGVCPPHAAAAAAEALTQLSAVDWVEEALPFAPHDFASRQILWNGSGSLFTNADTVPALNGSGQLIAVADTGLDVGSCFFHYGQSVNSTNTNTPIKAGNLHTYWLMHDCLMCGQCPRGCSDVMDLEGHGTHVSGIAAGRANIALAGGSAAALENGLAYGASLFFQDISASEGMVTPPLDLSALFAPAHRAGARVHSNSWGCSLDNPTQCNVYSLAAAEVDSFMFDHPDFLVVFAAGNSGTADDGILGTVSSPATCKNCLSVGSSNIGAAASAHNWKYMNPLQLCQARHGDDDSYPLPPCCSRSSVGEAAGSACSLLSLSCCPWDSQTICCFDEAASANKTMLSPYHLSLFSSVGPTRDGRFKPDVVAPGHMIASANARNPFSSSASSTHCDPPPALSASHVNWSERAVQLMSGTSMAAPAVAAVAAIVRQWFLEGWYPSGSPDPNAAIDPSAALVRAVIAASAAPLDLSAPPNSPPSTKSGFGLPSLARALYISSIQDSSRVAVVDAASVPVGGSAVVRHGALNVVTADCSGGKVQVALAWNDPPGHPSASLQLVNDLDLLVWSTAAHGSKPALFYGNGGTFADSLNNLEKVSSSCAAGSKLTAAVYGAVVISPDQLYALVISGAVVPASLAATGASQAAVDAAVSGRTVQVATLVAVGVHLSDFSGLGASRFCFRIAVRRRSFQQPPAVRQVLVQARRSPPTRHLHGPRHLPRSRQIASGVRSGVFRLRQKQQLHTSQLL
jgi:subtilisin family serine protease